jgi:hypothetical protein
MARKQRSGESRTDILCFVFGRTTLCVHVRLPQWPLTCSTWATDITIISSSPRQVCVRVNVLFVAAVGRRMRFQSPNHGYTKAPLPTAPKDLSSLIFYRDIQACYFIWTWSSCSATPGLLESLASSGATSSRSFGVTCGIP